MDSTRTETGGGRIERMDRMRISSMIGWGIDGVMRGRDSVGIDNVTRDRIRMGVS